MGRVRCGGTEAQPTVNMMVVGLIPILGNEIFNILIWQSAALIFTTQYVMPRMRK